ncbi:MAG: ATP-binding protein [Pseudonocardia sp.]
MSPSPHVERRVTGAVLDALAWSPVVAVTGPRIAGKSTLVRRLTARHGGSFVDLDDPDVRRLAAADPVSFVRDRPEPVVVDEFQRVPALLGAMKAELNRDRRPGRYVLAGSARHEAVPELADFLTGRVELIELWPFAVAELEPATAPLVDRLFARRPLGRPPGISRPELVELVLRGGYPIAVGLPPAARRRWFTTLAALVVERITDDVRTVRDIGALRRFLRLTAAATAQTRNAAEIGRELGIGRDQANTYLRLLELVYLTIELPAWSTNAGARITKRPKLHLADSGLAAHLQGLSADQLAATDPAGAAAFGALLETFVVTEVVKQLGWAETAAVPHHYRTPDGVEVDLVLEATDGRVVAIEVKAAPGISPGATRGLAHLRDRLGDRFVAGLVLSTGDQAQRIGDRLAVAPVSALWS